MRKPTQDRRKVNVPTADDKRGTGKESRKCPDCHSGLQQSIQQFPGGTWTVIYCTKCSYKSKSKQIDEDRMRQLLGFEGNIVGTLKKPLLELDPDFLKFAGVKPGDSLEVKPVFTPGADHAIQFILKKI